jgi:hypothetical protein
MRLGKEVIKKGLKQGEKGEECALSVPTTQAQSRREQEGDISLAAPLTLSSTRGTHGRHMLPQYGWVT